MSEGSCFEVERFRGLGFRGWGGLHGGFMGMMDQKMETTT